MGDEGREIGDTGDAVARKLLAEIDHACVVNCESRLWVDEGENLRARLSNGGERLDRSSCVNCLARCVPHSLELW